MRTWKNVVIDARKVFARPRLLDGQGTRRFERETEISERDEHGAIVLLALGLSAAQAGHAKPPGYGGGVDADNRLLAIAPRLANGLESRAVLAEQRLQGIPGGQILSGKPVHGARFHQKRVGRPPLANVGEVVLGIRV